MLNNTNNIVLTLKRLGLTPDEAKVYIVLLEKPMSHLEIARRSGVNRTKVYRIADNLIKRGLIAESITDAGRELVANDPANLEISITTAEEKLKSQRQIFDQTLPALQGIFKEGSQTNEKDFVVNTYEGSDGFKQMLWNELKTQKEILIFGNGTIQDLIASTRWAEKHRMKTVEAGYKIREVYNPGGKHEDFTTNAEFLDKTYHKRYISQDILPLSQQICIYNNTVSIYNWRNNQKVGTEIINKQFADTQRAVFEHYWALAEQKS